MKWRLKRWQKRRMKPGDFSLKRETIFINLQPHSLKKKKSTWERAQMNKIRFKTEITIEIKEIQRVIRSLLLSHVWLFATPWTAAHQASLSFTISWSLPKLMSIEYVMPSSHFILCHSLPALSLSQHQSLFQWINSSHQVAKVLELQHQHQSFQWIFRVCFL